MKATVVQAFEPAAGPPSAKLHGGGLGSARFEASLGAAQASLKLPSVQPGRSSPKEAAAGEGTPAGSLWAPEASSGTAPRAKGQPPTGHAPPGEGEAPMVEVWALGEGVGPTDLEGSTTTNEVSGFERSTPPLPSTKALDAAKEAEPVEPTRGHVAADLMRGPAEGDARLLGAADPRWASLGAAMEATRAAQLSAATPSTRGAEVPANVSTSARDARSALARASSERGYPELSTRATGAQMAFGGGRESSASATTGQHAGLEHGAHERQTSLGNAHAASVATSTDQRLETARGTAQLSSRAPDARNRLENTHASNVPASTDQRLETARVTSQLSSRASEPRTSLANTNASSVATSPRRYLEAARGISQLSGRASDARTSLESAHASNVPASTDQRLETARDTSQLSGRASEPRTSLESAHASNVPASTDQRLQTALGTSQLSGRASDARASLENDHASSIATSTNQRLETALGTSPLGGRAPDPRTSQEHPLASASTGQRVETARCAAEPSARSPVSQTTPHDDSASRPTGQPLETGRGSPNIGARSHMAQSTPAKDSGASHSGSETAHVTSDLEARPIISKANPGNESASSIPTSTGQPPPSPSSPESSRPLTFALRDEAGRRSPELNARPPTSQFGSRGPDTSPGDLETVPPPARVSQLHPRGQLPQPGPMPERLGAASAPTTDPGHVPSPPSSFEHRASPATQPGSATRSLGNGPTTRPAESSSSQRSATPPATVRDRVEGTSPVTTSGARSSTDTPGTDPSPPRTPARPRSNGTARPTSPSTDAPGTNVSPPRTPARPSSDGTARPTSPSTDAPGTNVSPPRAPARPSPDGTVRSTPPSTEAQEHPVRVRATEAAPSLAQSVLAAQVRSTQSFDTKPSHLQPVATPAAPRAVDSVVSRSKALSETLRISTPEPTATAHTPRGHAEEQKERDSKLKARPEESQSPAVTTAPPAPSPLPITATVVPDTPPPVAPALEPFVAQLVEDPSARISLTPSVARVSVDTGDAGRLSVQLKVTDGVTDVRASGPAAPMLDARQNELRVALAQEGLSLGRFDLSQRDQHRERPEPIEVEHPRKPSPVGRSLSDAVSNDGRIHVKA